MVSLISAVAIKAKCVWFSLDTKYSRPPSAPHPSNSTSGGFQLSLLSVPRDLLPLIQAVTGQAEQDSHLDRIKQQIWGYNQKVSGVTFFAALFNELVNLADFPRC